VASPYKDALLHLLPTGTFTLQDTPSLSRRDMLISGIKTIAELTGDRQNI